MSSIRAAAVLQLDQVANRLEDVALGEDLGVERLVDLELVVQLEAADLREVVALRVEEQVVEERLRRLERRRIARAEAAVDLHDRLFGRLDLVGEQRVAEVAADVEAVDEEDLELLDARLAQLLELVASVTSSLHSRRTSPVSLSMTSCAATLPTSSVDVDREAVDLRLLQLLDRGLGELAVLLDEDFASSDLDVARRALTGEELVLDALRVLAALLEVDRLRVVEVVEQLLRRVAERAEEHRSRASCGGGRCGRR